MFLVMLLIECLKDRRSYSELLYEKNERFVSIKKMIEETNKRICCSSTPSLLVELFQELLDKLSEYKLI